jgi:stage II sporulation protein D
MSWPNNEDKPASDVGWGRLERFLARRWLYGGVIGLAGVFLLALLFRGCERRPALRATPQMDAAPPFWVRVLLLAEATECTLSTPSGFQVLGPDASSGIPAGPPIRESTGAATKIRLADGRLLLGTTPLAAGEAVIAPEWPHIFTLNGQSYRGRLTLAVIREGRAFQAVNLVPLEPYLAGVVGAEMPDYWEPEALRAQAIAARTYCLYIKNRFGVNRRWDVSRTQAHQVYGGISAESSPIWNAVNSTHGKVLMAQEPRPELGPHATERRLFPAYYSSICGGHTAASEKVFGDCFGPLQAVPCPYCRDVAKMSLFFWPMAQFDRATVTRQLVERYPSLGVLGEIEEITVSEKDDYGPYSRATCIQLVGATGKTDTLRAEDFRLALDPTGRKIKSTMCQIVPWGDGWAFLAGRGWGHGVGMCQCGAEGMARLGSDAEVILQYYYPGCEMVSVY